MEGQMSIFDFIDQPQPGDYVEEHGRRLPFDWIHLGDMIVIDCSTESHEWFQVGRVEGICDPVDRDGRKLFVHTGGKHHAILSEQSFRHMGTKVYELRRHK